LPVFAFSVLPATAALVLGVRLPWAFAVATVLGALSGVAGYLFAFFYQFPVGGSQTVMAAVFSVLAIVVQLARGRPLRLALPARARALSPPP
jgi:zinc transport system permease protein